MKYLYVIILIFITSFLSAQTANGRMIFDPSTSPVAIQQDSTLHLLVSDFVLSESLKKQLPQVDKVDKVDGQAGVLPYINIVLSMKQDRTSKYNLVIYLNKDINGLFYLSNHSVSCGVTCSDCKGCTCCSPSNGLMGNLKQIFAPITLEKE